MQLKYNSKIINVTQKKNLQREKYSNLNSEEDRQIIYQKQPPGGVPKKRCSENMQQIYRRTPMLKRDFNKVAKELD